MNAFARAATAIAADANLGAAVIFQPKDAARVPCRGVFSRPEDEFGSRVTAGLMLAVPAAALPRLPIKGDEVELTAPLILGATTLRAGLTLRVERATAEESMAMFDIVLSVP
jgi:hypothetical protein